MRQVRNERMAEESYYIASQWQLVARKFFKHKIALVSLAVIAIFYLVAIFAEFVAPNDPRGFAEELVLAPIQRIHFRDDGGDFHLRPFVYKLVKHIDKTTWQLTYTEDRATRFPIHLLVRGDSYRMWGLFLGNLHLFGTKEGAFSILGRDRGGRDLFLAWFTAVVYRCPSVCLEFR